MSRKARKEYVAAAAPETLPKKVSLEQFVKWHPGYEMAFKYLYEDASVERLKIPEILSQGFDCQVTAGNSIDSISARVSALGRQLGFRRPLTRCEMWFCLQVVKQRAVLPLFALSQSPAFSISSLAKILQMPRASVRKCMRRLGVTKVVGRREQIEELLKKTMDWILRGEKQPGSIGLDPVSSVSGRTDRRNAKGKSVPQEEGDRLK